MTKISIALLALLALGGCEGFRGTFLAPDKNWQNSGAKTFWEDRDRRSGGSAE